MKGRKIVNVEKKNYHLGQKSYNLVENSLYFGRNDSFHLQGHKDIKASITYSEISVSCIKLQCVTSQQIVLFTSTASTSCNKPTERVTVCRFLSIFVSYIGKPHALKKTCIGHRASVSLRHINFILNISHYIYIYLESEGRNANDSIRTKWTQAFSCIYLSRGKLELVDKVQLISISNFMEIRPAVLE
jgi:hypothetical protein